MGTVAMGAALDVPPRDQWDQGDIVEAVYFAAFDRRMPAVLVTPSCDVEQAKVDLWTFIALFPDVDLARQVVDADTSDWQATRDGDGRLKLSGKKRKSLKRILLQLLSHRYPRYHWLPVQVGGSPAQVADFSCVSSLPAQEIRATGRRVASLRSSWREQLPARYAAFMGRVGTDDFLSDEVDTHLARLVDAFSVLDETS